MDTRFIEATNGPMNWGKFSVARFSGEERRRLSAVDGRPLIAGRGWGPNHIVVFDLQTGEGGIFLPGGLASADLAKRQIWVCPLFEPFLAWLYTQDLSDLDTLPDHVDLPDVEFAMHGYRRSGPNCEPGCQHVPGCARHPAPDDDDGAGEDAELAATGTDV